MAASGIKDILIANQIVGDIKIRRLVNLAAHADVMVVVDNADNVADLSRAAQAKGAQLRVLVEVNIGHNRCGVAPFEPALVLSRMVRAAPGLKYMGLMAYDGHCTIKVDPAEREAKSLEANKLLVETRRFIEQAGLPVEIVSASGTFTYQYATSLPGITEIQAGTYLWIPLSRKRVWPTSSARSPFWGRSPADQPGRGRKTWRSWMSDARPSKQAGGCPK
jgi:D-serine deaminase-like pyridoxal phosphate-dependent protein